MTPSHLNCAIRRLVEFGLKAKGKCERLAQRTRSARQVEFLAVPNPAPSLRPMVDFDPSEPAILHDSRTDCIVTWTGEDIAAYREEAIARPDGTVEWNGYIFDGWGNVLGG
jgi:hypothetical protein